MTLQQSPVRKMLKGYHPVDQFGALYIEVSNDNAAAVEGIIIRVENLPGAYEGLIEGTFIQNDEASSLSNKIDYDSNRALLPMLPTLPSGEKLPFGSQETPILRPFLSVRMV